MLFSMSLLRSIACVNCRNVWRMFSGLVSANDHPLSICPLDHFSVIVCYDFIVCFTIYELRLMSISVVGNIFRAVIANELDEPSIWTGPNVVVGAAVGMDQK